MRRQAFAAVIAGLALAACGSTTPTSTTGQATSASPGPTLHSGGSVPPLAPDIQRQRTAEAAASAVVKSKLHVGMTEADVQAVFGAPDSNQESNAPAGYHVYTYMRDYAGAYVEWTAYFRGGQLLYAWDGRNPNDQGITGIWVVGKNPEPNAPRSGPGSPCTPGGPITPDC